MAQDSHHPKAAAPMKQLLWAILGLGLALVKRLAEAMAGAVGVESSPGQGATFCLALPKA